MRIAAAVLVTLSMLAGPWPSSADEKGGPAAAAARSITISFKLDPRLSGPTYGGERWVSPPTYTGASAQDAVEARASAFDAQGSPTKASLDWSPSDPEMVTVAPSRGEQVKITVRRAGESNVTVRSGGATRKLVVKVVERNGSRQVTISQ